MTIDSTDLKKFKIIVGDKGFDRLKKIFKTVVGDYGCMVWNLTWLRHTRLGISFNSGLIYDFFFNVLFWVKTQIQSYVFWNFMFC